MQPGALLYGPDEKTLDALDTSEDRRRRLTAVCVVVWQEAPVEAWRRAHRAANLEQPEHEQPPLELDPVARAALSGLNGTIHSSDKGRSIRTLQSLMIHGYGCKPIEVKVWAMTHGWEANEATNLAGIAQLVLDGHQFRTKEPPLRPDVIDRWRQRAEEGDGK
jgi:hypothetical protein